jgi:pimeloyl-ACP methyl ester carboxylesterase
MAAWLPLLIPCLFCLPCCLADLLQHIPTVDDSVEVVLAALQRHELDSAAVLGHSYGSLVAARLVRVAPQVVHTLAVVDPVSLAAAAAAAVCVS